MRKVCEFIESIFEKADSVLESRFTENICYSITNEEKNVAHCTTGILDGVITSGIEISEVQKISAQRRFIIEYLNELYDTNMEYLNEKTVLIFTVLHEIGHHVNAIKHTEDYNNYRANCLRETEEVNAMECTSRERWLAYRQKTSEYDADKFAIEFMKEHYTEYLYPVELSLENLEEYFATHMFKDLED
jgi:hypothetical protein